jgi:D-glycero-alpha-D-manno-heptose 1-phosphate guanylyltransferase
MKDPLEEVSAAILAGGLGSRLRPVVVDRPKVLATVGGRPFLSRLIQQLALAKINEAVLLVGYGAEQVRAEYGDRKHGVNLRYSVETELLGTGGAVRLALPMIPEKTLLLMNGDSFCNLDLRAFIDYHRGHGGEISLSLAWMDNASRFGRIALGQDDRIAGFEEKSSPPGPGWINAGVYLIERELFELVKPNSRISLERELLPGWISKFDVFGFRGGEFIDIGVPESYAQAGAFFHSINGE